MLTQLGQRFAVGSLVAFVAGTAVSAAAIAGSDGPNSSPGETVVLLATGIMLLAVAVVLAAGCVAAIVVVEALRSGDPQPQPGWASSATTVAPSHEPLTGGDHATEVLTQRDPAT